MSNVDVKQFHMLPPGPGKCAVCALVHEADEIHDQRSLFYQMQFHGRFGRWPTWEDAAAHLSPENKAVWQECLRRLGIEWTRPPEGVEVIDQPFRLTRQI
jgi:hypothetical protein